MWGDIIRLVRKYSPVRKQWQLRRKGWYSQNLQDQLWYLRREACVYEKRPPPSVRVLPWCQMWYAHQRSSTQVLIRKAACPHSGFLSWSWQLCQFLFNKMYFTFYEMYSTWFFLLYFVTILLSRELICSFFPSPSSAKLQSKTWKRKVQVSYTSRYACLYPAQTQRL